MEIEGSAGGKGCTGMQSETQAKKQLLAGGEIGRRAKAQKG